jgi:hypothetical protein
MLKDIIDLLKMSDYYGVDERIDIAKGKYEPPKTLKEAFAKRKRFKQYNNGSQE